MFAKKLRELRKRKDITQVLLAQMLEVSQQTVARWESGAATPPLDTISRIAKFFGVPTSYFIENEPGDEINELSAYKAAEAEVSGKFLDAINSLFSAYQLIPKIDGSIEDFETHRLSVLKTLEENPEAMKIATRSFKLVLYALSAGAMELSKVNLNRAIAGLTEESFDTEQIIQEVKERVAKRIQSMVEVLPIVLMEIPDAIFAPLTSKSAEIGGDSDGEH